MFFKKHIFFIILPTFFLIPFLVDAASIWISPSTGTYTVGEEFSVSVRLDSGENNINVAEGNIVFNSNRVEVVGVSLSGSIFNIWTIEPEFSNESGVIRFAGGATRGFDGDNGRLFDIVLRAKRAEMSSVNFSSAAVLTSDGTGSNVLEEMRGGAFSFVPRTISPTPEAFMPDEGGPEAPNITSPTHPDEFAWYADSSPVVRWDVPAGVNAVRTIVDDDPNIVPTVQYSPPTTERDLGDLNLSDGVWYFRAQFRNQAGWGEIATFRVNIDTEPPERFNMSRIGGEDPTDPMIQLSLDAFDEMSGIDYYEIVVNDLEPIVWRESEGGIGPLGPGRVLIVARAYDGAGNHLLDSIDMEIEPLESPVVTHHPSRLPRGEALVVQGEAKPSSDVVVWLQKGHNTPVSYSVKSRSDGSWTFINEDELSDGVYSLWVESVDDRGARSLPGEEVRIVVSPPQILVIGSFMVDALAVIIPLIALVFFLSSVVVYGYGQFRLLKKKVGEDVSIAEDDLHNAFKRLKKDVERQIDSIEKAKNKRDLHDKEREAVINLKKSLIRAERRISKDMSDIRGDVK